MYNLKPLFNHKLTKTLFYTCAIRYPKHNPLLFPFYMFLIYAQIRNKNQKFHLKSIPYKLMKELLSYKNDKVLDVNNTIIVNINVLQTITNRRWAKLLIQHENKLKSRIVYVIGLNNTKANELLLTETACFNLKLNQNNNNNVVIYGRLQPFNNTVNYASYVDISLINTEHDVINVVTDELLKNYFKTSRIVNKNDLIQIEVKDYCPKYYYTLNKINEIKYVYFKCNKIRFDDDFDCDGIYLCSSDKSTLKQSANTQSFLIPTEKSYYTNKIAWNNEINVDKCTINICPFGLDDSLKLIEDCVKPFLDERKQHFFPTS